MGSRLADAPAAGLLTQESKVVWVGGEGLFAGIGGGAGLPYRQKDVARVGRNFRPFD